MARPARTPLGPALAAVAALALLISLPASAGRTNQSSALWHVVHDLCVTDMKVSGLPAPCVAVNLGQGYAVLKDLRGKTQLLLIPTARVTGIESPALLSRKSPNYWQDAWDARPLFERGAGKPVPREDLGLAINSEFGRTQNQLHIHIDCLKPAVRDALAADRDRIDDTWSDFTVPFYGHHYRVRRVSGEDLAPHDPFRLLAEDPRARDDMAHETLVVAGAQFDKDKSGFYLLSDRADLAHWNEGAGEELLDHSCAALTEPAVGGH
jgi:CDP-diacylglycerol pyrophosphatase